MQIFQEGSGFMRIVEWVKYVLAAAAGAFIGNVAGNALCDLVRVCVKKILNKKCDQKE